MCCSLRLPVFADSRVSLRLGDRVFMRYSYLEPILWRWRNVACRLEDECGLIIVRNVVVPDR